MSPYADVRFPHVAPTIVDGVPVFFVRAPRPRAAYVGLVFGVGRAYEDAPMAGISHLVVPLHVAVLAAVHGGRR